MKYYLSILLIVSINFLSSCVVLDVTGNVIKMTGRAIVATVKVTGRAIGGTVQFFRGKKKIKLIHEHGSYYVWAEVKKKKIKFLIDTGATSVQIPRKMVKRLGIRLHKSNSIMCELANGQKVKAYRVTLNRFYLNGIKIKNLEAIILDDDNDAQAGLLGMSFLDQFHFKIDTEKHILTLKHKK
ncbi:MAG: hypothetical protein COA79_20115 [Planctomycetota bacterium]|nr:MAG: hypothetical protein COA79_20115 [Planctomycetota bacterium]